MLTHSEHIINCRHLRDVSYELFSLRGFILKVVHSDLTVKAKKSRDTFYDGAFACTVRADKYSDFTVGNIKADIIISKNLAIFFSYCVYDVFGNSFGC